MTSPDDNMIMVGAIMGAHGVRGQVKVKCFMEEPADFKSLDAVCFGASGAPVEIKAAQLQKLNILVVTFGAVTDRDQAQALKSTQLFVPRSQIEDADDDPDAFFLSDLEGLRVLDEAQRVVGTIKAVNNFGASDVLEIALEGSSKSVMLPFIEDAVPHVDLAAGHIVIDPAFMA